MGRGYSREAYLSLVEHARSVLPGVSISSDFISGFCGETEADHEDTLSLMETVRYDQVRAVRWADETHKQADRQTNKTGSQTGSQADRQTGGEANNHETNKPTNKHTNKQSRKVTEIQTNKHSKQAEVKRRNPSSTGVVLRRRQCEKRGNPSSTDVVEMYP